MTLWTLWLVVCGSFQLQTSTNSLNDITRVSLFKGLLCTSETVMCRQHSHVRNYTDPNVPVKIKSKWCVLGFVKASSIPCYPYMCFDLFGLLCFIVFFLFFCQSPPTPPYFLFLFIYTALLLSSSFFFSHHHHHLLTSCFVFPPHGVTPLLSSLFLPPPPSPPCLSSIHHRLPET